MVLIVSGCASTLPYDPHLRVGERIDLGEITSDELPEISGIVASRKHADLFWVHNDSGGGNRIYAIDQHAQLRGTVLVPGCPTWDWEAIATGPGPRADVSYIYIANTGDNLQLRKEVQVCRFPEPDVQTGVSEATDVEVLKMRYPDRPHDAEALFVDPSNGDLYLITKRDAQARVFRLQAAHIDTAKVNTLEAVSSLPITGVCAADISADRQVILIKTLGQAYVWWLEDDEEDIVTTLQRLPTRTSYVREPQGEAIAWGARREGYYTASEKVFGLPSHLYFYPIKRRVAP